MTYSKEVELLLNSILNGDDTPIQNRASLVQAILTGEDSPQYKLSTSPEGVGIIRAEIGAITANSNASRKLDFPSSFSSSTTKNRIPLRRKRQRLDNAQEQLEQKYDDYQKFKNQNHSLYLSASQVAAMVGLHPYTIIPKLCMDLVYQGRTGQAMLRYDAKLLHISLVDEVESLREIAWKGGKDIKKALEQAINIGNGKENVTSIQNASKIKEEIVSKVKESKKLSKGEIKILVDGMRHNVNTGFGKAHEEDALDLYETQCGWEVTERNAERKTWRFIKAEDANDANSEFAQNQNRTVVPLDEVIRNQSNTQKESKNETIKDDSAESDAVISKDKVMPYFSINGFIDGIRDELYHVPSVPSFKDGSSVICNELNPKHMQLNYSDDDEWALRKVVVECKHRMNKAFDPPPIYDQIQAIIYAFMHNTSEAELVQVVRNQKNHSDTKTAPIEGKTQNCVDNETFDKKNEAPTSVIITSSRISLDDPVMRHRENWYTTVLPRLRSFVDAVYTIRRDDDKRYRLLRAAATASSGGDDTAWWNILHNECPFLLHCDTAYSRRRG